MEKEIKMGFLERLFQAFFGALVFGSAFAVPIAMFLFLVLDETFGIKRIIMASSGLTAFIVLFVVIYIKNKKYELR